MITKERRAQLMKSREDDAKRVSVFNLTAHPIVFTKNGKIVDTHLPYWKDKDGKGVGFQGVDDSRELPKNGRFAFLLFVDEPHCMTVKRRVGDLAVVLAYRHEVEKTKGDIK